MKPCARNWVSFRDTIRKCKGKLENEMIFFCFFVLDITTPTQWHLGKDYYRLDGKTPKSIRHAMINEFNNQLNERARVFLISAKAGGQGINLIGANRVIILDTSWNPSNDQQNIFRVFRLGQKRNCYIYRLLAMVGMEFLKVLFLRIY